MSLNASIRIFLISINSFTLLTSNAIILEIFTLFLSNTRVASYKIVICIDFFQDSKKKNVFTLID